MSVYTVEETISELENKSEELTPNAAWETMWMGRENLKPREVD